MARSTMTSLIQTLRGLTYAGTADYTAGTVAYWTDDQLQTVLDRHRFEIREEMLSAYPVTVGGGTVQWYDYQSQYRWYESTDGGTARYIIKDTLGATVSASNYSANYENGLITFTSNTGGTVYTVTGFVFDMYGAAADVWNQKAAYYATSIDFSTDNHNVRRSHILQNCERMAARYEAMSGTPYQSSNVATIYRGDAA